MMRVLVVGSGGREHALCWSLQASPLLSKLWCAPGNPGIADVAECVAIGVLDVPALVEFAKENKVDLVIPGPEAPLVAGITDAMERAGIRCFGPSAAAAQLEGSKTFTKEVADAAEIPTALWERFDDAHAAAEFVRRRGAPIVIKADGLAAGKGVVVAQTEDEALAAIQDFMTDGTLGVAGTSVVIEECLFGEEASFFALCDGTSAIALGAAQDHKRAYDGDTGPNTGGMGAFSPVPSVDDALVESLVAEAVAPLVVALRARGIDYRGVLYAGLMLTPSGPKVLEFNVRFGDPETQVVLPRYDGDLCALLAEVAAGALVTTPRFIPDPAVCVVLASEGYPEAPRTGDPIRGLDEAGALPGVTVLHAGTARGDEDDDGIITSGGRVLGVTALGGTLAEARTRAYAGVAAIDWPGMQHRTDIARDAAAERSTPLLHVKAEAAP